MDDPVVESEPQTQDASDDVQSGPPMVHVRWFHAGPPMLLSSAPIALGPQPVWQALTREESDACEDAWRQLSGEDKEAHIVKDIDPESDDDDVKVGIPVSMDKLFEVDVKAMKLYPVYWRTASQIPVTRGQWMHDESRPVESSLSELLEAAYIAVKPWQVIINLSYIDELKTALELGPEAQEKLKYPLVQVKKDDNVTAPNEMHVIFEDGAVARVYTGGTGPKRFNFLGAFGLGGTRSSSVKPTIYGGTVYYRGSDEAAVRIKAAQAQTPNGRTRSGSVSSSKSSGSGRRSMDRTAPPNSKRIRTGSVPRDTNGSDVVMLDASERERSATSSGSVTTIATPPRIQSPLATSLPSLGFGRPKTPAGSAAPVSGGPAVLDAREVDDTGSVTDLILVVHGIGQGLTATYEAFDFVYATNIFREVARKQSQAPAISSIMRNKRVQFLPVQWRASLQLDLNEELEKQREGLDNHFTLADITVGNTIPFVRELTNNVLLDIPLFMSHHRERMIASVCRIANRTYRLWCARNPSFEKEGKVHIIAHSLGSALVSHILSSQPTVQPLLSETSLEARNSKTQFLFNTSSLFLVGSPLGVFIHLNQRQIIARRGRERTMKSPPDEALDRVGIFGCMSCNSIYNIFNPADPVVYLLNPCVDSEKAKELPAKAIPDVTEGYMTSFSTKVTKIFEGLPPNSWFSSSAPGPSSAPISAKSNRKHPDDSFEVNSGIELAGETENVEGTKAERRFGALNPHGTLDFYLPSEGNLSEYVDMITAHSSYWADPSLAAFVLTEIFATQADLMRTAVGVGPSSPHPGMK